MDGMRMEWRTQGRLEPMWCDTWLRRETRTQNSAQMCSLIHVAHVVLCVLVLVGVRRVTVVIVHIGHDEVLVVIQILRSYFCRDFLYQEMYSLHEGELVLVVRNYFGTLKICNLEPRVFTWWTVIILFSMCCDTLCAPVHAVWAGVLFTHPVGCLEVFFQSTETGPNSEKKSRTVRPWRMLRIPTARLLIVSIPICWRGRSCRQVTLQFPQTLVLFAVFFCWLRGMVQKSCWVFAMCSSCNLLQSLFAWAKSNSLSFCRDVFSMAILSNCIISFSVHPMSSRCSIVQVWMNGFCAFLDELFAASLKPCSTFFVVQKVHVWHAAAILLHNI